MMCSIRRKLFSGAAIFAALTLALSGANEEFRREISLGDAASGNLDFRRAAEYYANAVKFAGQDELLYGEAAERLGGALIRSGDVAGAAALLKEWRTRFPDGEGTRMALLHAELLVAERKYAEAEQELDRFFSGRPIRGGNYLPLLNLRALAQFRQGKYAESADNYAMLEAFARGGGMEFPAWVRKTVSLFESKRFAEADRSLDEGRRFSSERQRNDVENLRLLGMLYRNESNEFASAWEKRRADALKQAEKGAPDAIFSELCLRAGRIFAGRDAVRAEEFFQLAFHSAETGSEKRAILLELAAMQEKNKRAAAAAETLKQYLDFFPQEPPDAAIMIRAAGLFRDAGKNAEALELLRQVASEEKNPMDVRRNALRLRSGLLADAGQLSRAVTEIRQLIGLSGTAKDKFESAMLLGDFYFRSGDNRAAAEAFGLASSTAEGAKDSAGAGRAEFWILQSLLREKDYPAAEKEAGKLLAFPEYRERAIHALGNIFEFTGKLPQAAKEYARLLKEFPRGELAPDALYRAAAVEEKRGAYAAAAGLYRKFAETCPGHDSAPSALYSACECAYAAGRAEEAAKILALFQKQYPKSPLCTAAMLKECDRLKAAGNNDGALEMLDKISALREKDAGPELRFQLMLDRAKILKLKKDDPGAVGTLEKLIEGKPSGEIAAEAAFLLGNDRFDRGRYADAIKLYRYALEHAAPWQKPVLSGRLADGCYSLGSSRSDRKLLDEAARIYDDLAKNSADVNFKLQCLCKSARTAEASGDDARALKGYRDALYLAQAEKRSGRRLPDEHWAGRALHGAVELLSRRRSMVSGREIIRLVSLYRSLGYGKNEDLQPIIDDAIRRYRLPGEQKK